MTPHEHREPSYQVVVEGNLRPAALAFCSGLLGGHKTAGAFQLRMRDDQGIADLVARLQVAGLMILSIRRLSPAEVAAGEAGVPEFIPRG